MLDYPQIHRGRDETYLDDNLRHVGLDFEFRPESYKPTALGISARGVSSSLWWNERCERICKTLANQQSLKLVGHNALGAEDEVMKRLGHEVPLERWEDTMILLYLVHPEFTSTVKENDDGEEGSSRGIGFLDLWSMASLYTDLPQWKRCRGNNCSGPCPSHDELGYNGVDAFAVDVAYPGLQAERRSKSIPDALYHRIKQLTLITNEMQRRGVYVDLERVEALQERWKKRKEEIFSKGERPRACGVCARMQEKRRDQVCEGALVLCKRCRDGNPPLEEYWSSGYNPNSPQQAVKYFKDKYGIVLEKWDKDTLERAKGDYHGEAQEDLEAAYEWKAEGKGFEPWFNANYLGNDQRFHPRTNPCGSSLGRFSSSNPNFQNIPKVGFGAEIRDAIRPQDDSHVILRADYSQGEFRGVLWYAFTFLHDRPMPDLSGRDIFSELAAEGERDLQRYVEISGRSTRDGAKTVVHAADYFEGIQLITPAEMTYTSTIDMEAKGILLVYRDWQYKDATVAFTGVNLARRMFGSATHENRRRALALQQLYLNKIPEVREFQKWVTTEAEKGYLNTASGRYIPLTHMKKSETDRLKLAAAAYGQGLLADYCQEAMVRYWERHGKVALLQVHDELLWEADRGASLEDHYEWLQIMSEPSDIFEGFSCPIECKIGESWKGARVFEPMREDYQAWLTKQPVAR